MKQGKWMWLAGCALLAVVLAAPAQTIDPGTVLGFSRDASGTLSVSSVNPGGCPTLVCTTSIVTSVRCSTNCYWKLVCVTNDTGQVRCTNALVCKTLCYTNTFPDIMCTNAYLKPTSVAVEQRFTGAIAANGTCDELAGLFPSNAVLQAVLFSNVRTNDWRGSHTGGFKIVVGTNIVATGSLSGVNGVGSHAGLEPCSVCNHLEGSLKGSIVQSGPLRGARISASYKADVSGVTCPSADVPQGAASFSIDGTVVIPCPFIRIRQ